MFKTEREFEDALIQMLTSQKGWEGWCDLSAVINNPTEDDLIENWAQILFANNRGIDRLNDTKLTRGEMAQIIEQINTLKTPLNLNTFINGTSVTIKRDNPADELHVGKNVTLHIYDRMEVAKGKSVYQIARQPQFPTRSALAKDRRGDLMLLINGMPVFHIELKKSGVPLSNATNQIELYAHNGIFSGLFALVQIFVAMTPEDCVYFANPGPEGKFNSDYFFRWADINNAPITDWKGIASHLISIPMAHQLIGFYTVADTAEGILKVMRSYQYWAAHEITDSVAQIKWDEHNQLGGYIWHTTGSGKTMTSFKSAQLIAASGDADKVVFLVDRIELGTQSLDEYRSFKNVGEEVQATEDSFVLRTKLKSTDPADILIVTSIQKLNQIKDEDGGMIARDIEIINAKRIVFIVDEAHRSTFGDMLRTIKDTFPRAVFFGFTGTPIHIENEIKGNTTADIFGSELHRYSIAHGIRDKNVLGFDLYRMPTFQDREVRKVVGLAQAKAKDEAEAFADPKKKAVYLKFLNEMDMAGHKNDDGKYIKGVEDYLPNVQYSTTKHQTAVVDDIITNWVTLSQNSKFHAILATSSIPEAIEYYRLLKSKAPDLRVTALFDPHTDLQGDGAVEDERFKQAGLEEIIGDYNIRYFGKSDVFKVASHAKFKKDLAWRLAHKEVYKNIEPGKQLDLLIVVKQMLTGFDSKWVNTLYIDKLMEYAHIIQAFSRTNRLFDPYEKPFGVIRYYRRTHTMERNIKLAVKAYSGDKEFALYVDKLPENIRKMNQLYDEIRTVFERAGVSDFTRLPKEDIAKAKFALLFRELYACKESARLQGFKWSQLVYEYEEDGHIKSVELKFDELIYNALLLRYKELLRGDGSGSPGGSVPYDIDSHISELNTGKINGDYMNSQFDIYMKVLNTGDETAVEEALNDLHKSFSSLTAEEQRYAEIFLRDVRRGEAVVETGKTLREYITEYQLGAKNKQIKDISTVFGLDENMLRDLMKLQLTEANLNELGRFVKLTATVDKVKAKTYFESKEGSPISGFAVNMKISKELQRFVLEGGFDIEADEQLLN